jgi:hypothetical protein
MTYATSEYSKPTVGAPGCSYASLHNYNQNYFGRANTGAPKVASMASNEVIIVPSYGASGYRSLMHQKQPTCSGYYSVSSAYPRNGCATMAASSMRSCRK